MKRASLTRAVRILALGLLAAGSAHAALRAVEEAHELDARAIAAVGTAGLRSAGNSAEVVKAIEEDETTASGIVRELNRRLEENRRR